MIGIRIVYIMILGKEKEDGTEEITAKERESESE